MLRHPSNLQFRTEALQVLDDLNQKAQVAPPTAGAQPFCSFRQTQLKDDGVQVHHHFLQALPKADMTQPKDGVQAHHAFQPTWLKETGERVYPCSCDHRKPQVFLNQSAVPKNAVPLVACGAPTMLIFPDVVARVWRLLREPEKVKHALLAALPDHYED